MLGTYNIREGRYLFNDYLLGGVENSHLTICLIYPSFIV